MEKLISRVCAALMAMGVTLMAAFPVWAFAALQTNYDWYRGHEADTSYTIGTAGEMKALAKLVNGTADYDGDGKVDSAPVDFAGKAVKLGGVNITRVLNYLNEGIEPIGTAEHPFKGAFDGSGWTAENFTYSIAADAAGVKASNVGLFGYVGEGGSVSNLGVANASITVERSAATKEYVENVGMVVGYCAGSVRNCSNAGALTVRSAVAQKSAADYVPVRNVGGVVGQCVFDVAGCSNSGNVTVAQTASPDADIRHGQLVARVGGVAGLAGDATRIGTFDSHIYGESDKHGSVSGCTNTGMVLVDTPELGQLDRFGKKTNAESVAIGGVVGYSQGSVGNCTNGRAKEPALGAVDRNVGYVRAENGLHVGGVCGSLRGVLSDNTDIAWADDGADGKDPLVMDDCTNYGDVYARVTAGGIAGKTSSYTTVTGCLNLNKQDAFGNSIDSYVVATRWNKPSPGGVVGDANGVVSYCANLATVASAVWNSESNRTLTTQDGYYAAGIAGMLTYFDDQAPAKGGVTTPVAELYGCYNAGTITAGAGMRQRGIVGQNDGIVHDNVLLKGKVDYDKIVYGDSSEDKEASGTARDNVVVSVDDFRGTGSAEAVARLNRNCQADGWERFWIISRDAVAKGLNGGYPLLNRQDPWGDAVISVEDAALELVEDARYTGGESTPKLKVTVGGAVLTENADYRVVPEAGATEVTAGKPYKAKVVGLGRYAGTSKGEASYGIVAGDFSTCSVTVMAHTFNYEKQVPSADEVIVTTPAGTRVPADEYTYAVVDDSGAPTDAVNAGVYRLAITPSEGSTLFEGSLEGSFRVKPASFMREVDFGGATITYLGAEYPWVDSTKKGESDNPTVSLPYTGVAVKPEVRNITYNGHTLVEGSDYKVIYGNANSDEGNTGSEDQNNKGRKGGTTIGCVTVRYITGGSTNFSSYANMFFKIVDEGSKVDLSKATYQVPAELISDGQPIRPVELYLGAERLTEGEDYTIAYDDNVLPGTATFVATGTGGFSGTLEGSFVIGSGELVTLEYTFAGTGSKDDPYEATVTGAEYHGSRETFSLDIPETVEQDGHEYAVVAVGNRAFGGSNSNDFAGSVAAESKAKLSSVSLPASVRALGQYAFGCTTDRVSIALSSVDFAADSQLEKIGDCAFAGASKLSRLTVPAAVSTIGGQAFYNSGITELRFLTQDASLPSSVADNSSVKGAFRGCSNVVVYGFESAAAVRALAEANSGAGTGTHGGKGFTFKPFASFKDAVVSEIADQSFTGEAVTPAVAVTLGGERLVQGVDYELSYSNNVNAGKGTARAIVSGIGRWLGTIEKSFTITPVRMTGVEFSDLQDKNYDGAAASYEPRLTYRERRLRAGVDYTLSYADSSGKAIAAPTAPGYYRLVATGTGNFEGSRYRVFRIVAVDLEDALVSDTELGQREYTGTPIEPNPNIKLGASYLERGVDYVLTYSDNVKIGTATVTARGIGGYEGEKSWSFRIGQASLKNAAIGGVPKKVQVSAAAVKLEPAVVLDGRLLAEGTDYAVSYSAVGKGSDGKDVRKGLTAPPSEVGSYELTVTGEGNYTASATAAFSIVDEPVADAADLSAASVALEGGPFAYNGAAVKPAVAVKLGSDELEAGEDYLVYYENNVMPTSAGKLASAVVYGIGDYEGMASAEFEIAKAKIADADVSSIADTYYDGGAERCPVVAVRVSGRDLVEGLDYTLGYASNVKVGTARVTVTGKGGYTGEVVREFGILPVDLATATVEVADQVYGGKGVALEPVPKVTFDGRSLDPKSDYTVRYESNTAVGTGYVIVSGKGNYTGEATASFAIARKSLAGARVTAAAQSYTGKELKPQATVTMKGESKPLEQGVDYQVAYSQNINAGQGKITVTGLGNYTGTSEGSFPINPINISGAAVTVSGATYTGAELKPPVTVKLGSAVLPASCYSVAYSSNVNAGSGKVSVKGIGNYSGTASATFNIAPVDLSKASVSVAKVTYTGKALKPKVTVKLAGSVLAAGNYKVAYSNNKNASTAKKKAKATVTGVGNYKGVASATFSIAPKTPSLKVKGTLKTVKASAVKKKAQVLKLSVKSASKGKVTYKLKKSNKRIAFKSGKATLKKGTKKGKYSIKVIVKQAAKGNYAKATKTVTITFKVK